MSILQNSLDGLRWKTPKIPNMVSKCTTVSASSLPCKPRRYAVLGAGFAGISVAWHLLQHCSKTSLMWIDIYDEIGLGGAASGVSGGLLHPYSPKGKLLWNGKECWEEALKLLTVAEAAANTELQRAERSSANKQHIFAEPIVWRRGILRTVLDAKNINDTSKSAHVSLPNCKISYINGVEARELLPGMLPPSDFSLYMPQAVNIHPGRYLQALFMACQKEARTWSAEGCSGTEVSLHKRNINSLLELSGEYDAVIVCLGAKASLLPELAGKLPLSTCRGVIAHLELSSADRDTYGNERPCILSSAWLATQGPRKILIGATKEWNSSNMSSDVSKEEASLALEKLLPKVSAIYPPIQNWMVLGYQAGVRAMPPRTFLGALPILGCIDDFVIEYMQKDKPTEKKNYHTPHQKTIPKYWFVGGLGSRGLIYHAWLGKMIAKAVTSGNKHILPIQLTSWMPSNRRFKLYVNHQSALKY
ncbi:hypothetical protein SUGI_0892990 [Cryptomeria japonica]|uniref:uncharacterized protein LOC131046896 n=1 Tax=Cryptomeria japonica TaxID=3369 RepID=UPI0024147BB7|nr:uncharacterized protein LOC131046896 [Cryptomeria japonica]GLJ43028.1 hypothetical protein SUGI_0892990 [Cryptomeria japonica]